MRGLGKGFAPSASAASEALGSSTKIRQDRHPPGLAGTTFSLNEIVKYVREGRNDPRLRGWAGRVLIAAGKPKSVRGQAQAILDQLRKQTVYVQDPVNTELMSRPTVSLCLEGANGLCMPAADCDDLVICFASAMLSIGVETRIVGASYGTEQATHVLCEVLDDNGTWLQVDPSSPKFRVGESYPATKEWHVDPITGGVMQNGRQVSLGEEPVAGDFIGVGTVPFPHAFSPLAHGASYVPVGMMRGGICFPDASDASGGPAFPKGARCKKCGGLL